ncbi:hypothetical protein [Streptomyces viridochromogenes]|uniref:hypothetical protein n=1 Tax=Streptomyces viridochromogenes TaxID=1938 RepID=UPI00056B1725|nr:hypothetical protein [Streptomyces viridochromogenes]
MKSKVGGHIREYVRTVTSSLPAVVPLAVWAGFEDEYGVVDAPSGRRRRAGGGSITTFDALP